jgi:hypothetical protein
MKKLVSELELEELRKKEFPNQVSRLSGLLYLAA